MNFPGVGQEQLDELLQIAVGALADIGYSNDMTLEIARSKASRIYEKITAKTQEAESVSNTR